jgi:uncharacterized integral membrane protein (TIGR00698 family)
MTVASKILFILGLLIFASGFLSPPIALVAGILFGLTLPHPYPRHSRQYARLLLQASVVALGFGMNLNEVLKAGRRGIGYTVLGIIFAMIAGLLLGRLLKVKASSAYLISAGTAICGGSAIAAVGPILRADEEEMAVSLGTVFVFNSIALLVFPLIAVFFHLNEAQFGLWAALAIHDTSSVVGAAAHYGPTALVIATTVKLARALWIAPLALVTAAIKHNRSRIQIPWFILLFCLAAVVNTYAPDFGHVSTVLSSLGKHGLTVTLFLIGTGISMATLREVGWRPLLQGLLLWILVGVFSLYFICTGLISL